MITLFVNYLQMFVIKFVCFYVKDVRIFCKEGEFERVGLLCKRDFAVLNS